MASVSVSLASIDGDKAKTQPHRASPTMSVMPTPRVLQVTDPPRTTLQADTAHPEVDEEATESLLEEARGGNLRGEAVDFPTARRRLSTVGEQMRERQS